MSIAIVTGGLYVFSGCYTYDSITEDELRYGYPKPEHDVRIALSDGSIIESAAYLHILITEPIEVITGTGLEKSKSLPFKGVIPGQEIDSTKRIPTLKGHILVCWLKNKSIMSFNEGEYLQITKQDPTGFWCVGTMSTSREKIAFRGIITQTQIMKIEVETFDYLTIGLITAPIVVVLLVIEALSASPMGGTK